MTTRTSVWYVCLCLAIGIVYWSHSKGPANVATGIGNADVLQARYSAWAQTAESETWTIRLKEEGGHSSRDWVAHVTLELGSGHLKVSTADTRPLDVWLIDNQEGGTARPEVEDRMIKLGTTEGGSLSRRLSMGSLQDFEIDLVVVTPEGVNPTEGVLASGSPSLFHRLRARELATPIRSAGPAPGGSAAPFDLTALVEEGERLFTQETFGGNGRTCSTCHRPENNFTIDPAFIRTLPADDPLFVAETVPALNFEQNGGLRFEHPQMMRRFGLIVANVDGTDDLANKFTLRGVPHTLGLGLSLGADLDDGTTSPPEERTGWSGDGAPGSGTLRDFATGAVTQHYPLTLARMPGVDFILPTDAELDALAAFQLSLGRRAELDLETLVLADPRAQAGLRAFVGPGKCNTCHFNAGANFFLNPEGNRNFDTGVEEFRRPAFRGEATPPDGGFGVAPRDDGGFGDGTFNTPSLVESADTAPFFHNNSARTLRQAIAFYNTRAFNRSPAGVESGGIRMRGNQIRDIEVFLRTINAMENVREALRLVVRAAAAPAGGAGSILALAIAETEDAAAVTPSPGGGNRSQGRVDRAVFSQALTSLAEASDADAATDALLRNSALAVATGLLEGQLASYTRDDGSIVVGPETPGRGNRPDRGGGRRGRGGPDGSPSGRTLATESDLVASSETSLGPKAPEAFQLVGAYPNPFNPTTTISFKTSQAGQVTLVVYNLLGQEVRVLVNGSLGAGVHSAVWDGRNNAGGSVPTGAYLYHLSMEGVVQSGTLTMVK